MAGFAANGLSDNGVPLYFCVLNQLVVNLFVLNIKNAQRLGMRGMMAFAAMTGWGARW